MKRVVVAMSGGVDSSVAAALLKEQGHEVVGITMCFSLPDAYRIKPACCGRQSIDDARRVAHKLGIKHYVLNFSKHLKDKVIDDFISEYLKARTPNPCVRCNQYLKFGILLRKALSLDADFIATGHYARITKSGAKYVLRKGKDRVKDQSYFLYQLAQDQLKHILFPLGNYTKQQVRNLARKFGLPVADKPGSQEICFLPGDDYREFLMAHTSGKIKPGEIVDSRGRVLGKHEGIAFYTIGQREGLGIACGYPVYITKIDAKNNRITIGNKEEVHGEWFIVNNPHFIGSPIKKKIAAHVKIRYNHKETPVEIIPFGKKIKVALKKPQFAVTPGQSAVFYNKDVVLGGGIISLK